MAATFVVYADSGSNCRWRLVASNGETIASFGGIVLLDVRRAGGGTNVKVRGGGGRRHRGVALGSAHGTRSGPARLLT